MKIIELIKDSKYSIHDLSRCQSEKADDFYRLNMPFELGIDYGCRQFSNHYRDKRILYSRRKALSLSTSDL